MAVTTRAASVATSRAPLDACTISALRPAVSATAATRASMAARRWKGDAVLPARSRARVSTNPTSAQARVRPNATELAGAVPPGTAVRQPTTTPATVEREEEDLEQPERPEGGSTPTAGAATWASPPTSTCTSSRTVIGLASRTGRPQGSLRPVHRDPSVAHAHDPPRGRRDAGVVSDEHDRLPPGVQPAEKFDDLLAALGIQGAGWLVRQQQRRLVGQGARNGESLALPAREHARHRPRLVADSQQVEEITGAGLRRSCAFVRRSPPAARRSPGRSSPPGG